MNDLPLGLGMALAQNTRAMEYFSALPDQKKQEIINDTQKIRSRNEMRSYVKNLGNPEM